MSKIPPRILAVTFDPETPKSLIKILLDYFECVPNIPYIDEFKEVYYVLPDTKTIDYIFNNLYDYAQYSLTIGLLKGGAYNYNSKTASYHMDHGASILPACLDIKRLDRKKLEVFSED